MSETLRIGFLGAGKMATALAQGWIKAGLTAAEHVCASDPVAAAREHFTKTTGAAALTENAQVVAKSAIFVIAAKPQNMAELLNGIRAIVSPAHLLISIAAGVT